MRKNNFSQRVVTRLDKTINEEKSHLFVFLDVVSIIFLDVLQWKASLH